MTETTTAAGSSLGIRVSSDLDDAAWDGFVEHVPGGHHVQTTMWARVKAVVGWSAVRVIAARDGEIVAGAQILSRPIGRLGHVGYIANGPVAAPADAAAGEAVLDAVAEVVRERRIRHLTLQPPLHSSIPAHPDERRYLPSSTEVVPGATSFIDLDVDLDTVLGRMHRKTRYNVRTSGRKGITVRSGTGDDVAAYYSMVEATAQRRGFAPFPREYYEEMWRRLHPGGHLRLAVAELEGETIAAQMAITFGPTVVNKLSVWSGREGSRRPNEAIQWSTIQWAKENGYESYDLEGIDVGAARLLLADEPLPDSFDQTVTSFKLGFGGRVVLAPPPHEYVYNRVARWAFGEIYPRVSGHRTVKRLRKQLRTASR